MRSILPIIRTLLIVAALAAAGCGGETPQEPGDFPGPVTVIDTIPPSAVTSLIVQLTTATTVALQWISPGDDGDEGQAASYDIRYHDAEITEQNWDDATRVSDPPAPRPGNSVEVHVVKGLTAGSTHHFALKTRDEVPNESPVSNSDYGTTLGEVAPPSRVTDLLVDAVSDTEFRLTWTAPGDDDDEGAATAYDIRYSTIPMSKRGFSNATPVVDPPAPRAAGETETVVVGGLNAGLNYYFALRAVDDAQNWSDVSNAAPAMAMSNHLMVDPSTLPRSQLGLEDVLLIFRCASQGQRAEITISKWIRDYDLREYVLVVFRHLVDETFAPGTYRAYWDWMDDSGDPYGGYSTITFELYLDGELTSTRWLRLE